MIGLFLSIIFSVCMLFFLTRTLKQFKSKVAEEGKPVVVGFLIFTFTLLIVFIFMGYHEYNLMYNYVLVEGKLINECNSKGPGPSYEYEYFLDGKRYTNCTNAGNSKLIKFPGGKYQVRVSRDIPSGGRIDFGEQILE